MSYVTTAEHSSNYTKGVILVLSAGMCWSFAGLVIRLTEHVTEWQILFYRSLFLVATLLLYLTIKNKRQVLTVFNQAGKTGCIAGVILAFGFACWIFAITHTTVANALFVLASSSFIAAILGQIVLGEKVRLSTWIYMCVAASGVAIMVIEAIEIGTLLGNLFALGAATSFAVFAVALRKGKNTDMTPAVCWAGLWAMGTGSVMMVVHDMSFIVSPRDLALCASLGVVQVGMGLILFTGGSRYVPTAEMVLLSLTEVVLGPVWVWLVIHEIPTFYTIIGGVIVLGAIASQAIHGAKRRPSVVVV